MSDKIVPWPSTRVVSRNRELSADVSSVYRPLSEFDVVWITVQPPKKANRPICPNCRKPRRPDIHRDIDRKNGRVTCSWIGRWKGYGHFCTLACCQEYANLVIDQHLKLKPGTVREGLPPPKR